jgi:hypothetical protein
MNHKTLFIFLQFLLFCIIRVEGQPNIVWQKCLGGTDNDFFRDAIQTSDNGFITCLYTSSNDGDLAGLTSTMGWVIKFDLEFNIQWEKHYSTPDFGNAPLKVRELNNGQFVFGGNGGIGCKNFHGSTDLFLMKTNSLGDTLWNACFGSFGFEDFQNFLPTLDGGYLITGVSSSTGGDIPFHYGASSNYDAVILKTDSIGNLLWLKNLGGSADDSPLGNILEIERGYYVVHIGSFSDNYDLAGSGISGDKRWIIKLDSIGNIVHENIISGTSDFNSFTGEIIYNQDKILAVGASNSGTNIFPDVSGIGGLYDGGLAVFDDELNFVDLQVFGGTASDMIKRIEVDDLNNYYLLGYSYSDDFDLPDNYDNRAESDYWIMKTDENFNKIWSRNFGGIGDCGELGCSGFEGNLILKGNMLYAFLKNTVPDVLPSYDIQCGHISTFDEYDGDAWIVAFDLSTGIQNYFDKNAISIYPNPIFEEFTIEINIPGQYAISIFDMMAKGFYLSPPDLELL